ncbi:aldo/keto reductase [Virgibacillus sp. NKC19-3]|uniref:aldo/keto reductase n=1 Tax=Virgibacillus saliphilus TaxID=2831674 RepID=UPI001C9B1CFF|nr:aldo/keto reductase [Virgibacillus sp. NKC19-3]MBY7141871.1 aldo/keto reductase [Virgibacillus sp. NKC19-3]
MNFRYTDFPEGNPRRKGFQGEEAETKFEKVRKLNEVAKCKDTTLSHLALAWLLKQKGVDAIIPGGKRPEQGRSNAQAGEVQLTSDDLEMINEILK